MISKIDFTGHLEAERLLNGIRNKLIDPAYEARQTANYVEKVVINRRFNEQRNPLGQPWKPSIRAILEGNKTLTDTRFLRENIRAKISYSSIGPEISFVADGKAAVYGPVHNNGLRVKGRNGKYIQMPKRQFAFITQDEKNIIIRDIWIRGLSVAV
jgi:phage gpG-like protein